MSILCLYELQTSLVFQEDLVTPYQHKKKS